MRSFTIYRYAFAHLFVHLHPTGFTVYYFRVALIIVFLFCILYVHVSFFIGGSSFFILGYGKLDKVLIKTLQNNVRSVYLFLSKLQDVFNLLPNLNVAELIKAFAG